MRKIIILISIFLPILSFGQINENFSDGDFTQNPQWNGDISNYIINDNFQLQLNDEQASESHLYTSQNRLKETEWECWVKLSFSPSGNNYSRIYLASDGNNLQSIQNAVYIQLGESGSNDAITLFKITEGIEREICRGTEGLISSSFNFYLKVTVDAHNIWRIFIDTGGTGNYQLEAEGEADLRFQPQFYMIYNKYTVSNSTKFYIDNISVKEIEIDQTPPTLSSIEVLNEKQITVNFSEIIERTSAENINNYTVLPNTHPIQAQMMNENKSVLLTFENSFINETEYSLEIKNIADINDNVMITDIETFTYLQPYTPNVNEIVINELMVDVNPEPNELPAFDYLELYNTTNKLFDISGYKLIWGSHEILLPSNTLIKPLDFLLIADEEADYEQAENVIYFSSISLNNEAMLSFISDNDETIHAINYDKNWYHNKDKEDGGWSLEMIDTSNPCGGIDNYSASENMSGGTPGYTNSVLGDNPDNNFPELKSIKIIDPKTITLFFSETMDVTPMSLLENYLLLPNNISPSEVTMDGITLDKVTLHFNQDIFTGEGVIFTIKLLSEFTDCAGNPLYESEISFSNYTPLFGDVIITEIMADVSPEPRELLPVEYLELYNRTDYPIDLSEYILHTGKKSYVFEEGTHIKKKGYLTISESRLQLPIPNIIFDNFSVTNEKDEIYLENKHGEIIHYTAYNKNWFDDEVKEDGGWSLEMIDLNNWCGENENWSASISETGGTPGKENSINNSIIDEYSPDLLRIIYIDEYHVQLVFDENMHIDNLDNISSYSIPSNNITIEAIEAIKPSFDKVLITFQQALEENTLYSIKVDGEVKDCAGNNIITSKELTFSKPIIPKINDIVINEIMFNAADDGIDYLELYNLTNKSIDLSSIIICLADEVSGEIEKEILVSEDKAILQPYSYLAITLKKDVLLNKHNLTSPRDVLENEKAPNYTSTEGLVLLKNINNYILDSLYYHEDFHYALINDDKGISLERIDPTSASIKNNWHSAAENVNFATPGLINSQFYANNPSETEITIDPKVISPNNDGRNDVAVITFNVEKPGYSADVIVYDAFGREIKTLANNYLTGNDNKVFWDGTDDRNHCVPIGYYIAYIELFDIEGNPESHKKTIVVSEN